MRKKYQAGEQSSELNNAFGPPALSPIAHKRCSDLSKRVNEILDFTKLRKKLSIPLWGGNPISTCHFTLIIACVS